MPAWLKRLMTTTPTMILQGDGPPAQGTVTYPGIRGCTNLKATMGFDMDRGPELPACSAEETVVVSREPDFAGEGVILSVHLQDGYDLKDRTS